MKIPQLLPGILLTSSVAVMVATPATAEVLQVTGVRLNRTDGGLEIILETASGISPQVFTTSSENSLIIDVLNAQLALRDGDEFRQENPTEEIAEISLIQLTPNNIQVVITGTEALPEAEVVPNNQGLAISISTPSTTVDASSEPETLETEQEIEIVVTQTQAGERYLVPNATTGTRTETPLSDVPQSVQVIPKEIIQDQQATRIEEVLENVSGTTFLGNNDGRGVEFGTRGFEGTPVLRDGFRLYGTQGFPEVANLQQVEVLKGPASILYGAIEPGGLINLVSKKPLSEPFYEAELQIGNRDFFRPRIDFSGLLTANGNLLYRLNTLYQNRDSFRDYDNSFQRFFIAPSLTLLLNDRTDLTLNLEYINDDNPADFGTTAFGEGIADIPPERVINNPGDTIENESLNTGYTLEHRFSENWKLRNSFRYIYDKYDFSVLALPFRIDEEEGILTRFWADQFEEQDNFGLYTNVEGKFATGSIKHTLLFGVDYAHNRSEGQTRFDISTPVPLNIFDPDYDALPEPESEDIPIFLDDEIRADRLGIYLQDQIYLLDNLILLAGLRYDTIEQTRTDNTDDSEQEQSDDAFTPRVGIVYQPIETVSLYASYSRSFTPNQTTDVDGDFLEPEEGEGFEVGIKAELIPDRLSATLAYFDITKQNVATSDPNFPNFSVATGEQQSQGVEFDLIGEIIPGWKIIASYAYIDAEVTEDTDPDIVGNKLAGIPEHSASLWTTYELQTGNLQGLGFGLGFNFVDERKGDLANSFEADSYFVTNAAIFYKRNNWQAALNFKNLFDVNFIESVGNSRTRGIYPGEPFTVIGSISVRF